MAPPVRTQVIPDGWAEHHRPVVAGFFAGTVLLERKGAPTVDDLGTRHDTWVTVYDGPGLIVLQQNTESARDSAGVPIEVARYVGRMPITVRPQIGDRLTCTQSTDPAMVGREFWVSFDETQEFAVDRQVRLERLGDRGQG